MSKACDIRNSGSSALLSQEDPSPVRVLNPGAGAAFVIVCDHAGRTTPRALGDLGAGAEAFERHIALDIGAAAVTERLAQALGCTAVLQTYSRLVIDCNRNPEREDAVPTESDGTRLPGNIGLSAPEKAARVREIFAPYHAAISEQIEAAGRPVVVAVHSCTPVMNGKARPWTHGVLHMGASAFSDAMMRLLRSEPETVVGDNEPYAMDGTDYTVPLHAIQRGLDYLEIEIRQDLVANEAGQAAAADLLARLLPQALRPGA